MFFPNIRLRRMRSDTFSRDLISENHISVKDFIYPLFIYLFSLLKIILSFIKFVVSHSMLLLTDHRDTLCENEC